MTSSTPCFWLRAETKVNEHRSALTPKHCRSLIDAGFTIFVERCKERVFGDEEFETAGCKLVPTKSWQTDAPKNAYIVGLKELPENDTSPLSNAHIFFAHCFKEQAGWKEVLQRFKSGNGTLLDLEFLQDDKGRRVAAFGYHAGFAGSAVGIDVWCQQKLSGKGKLPPIRPYANEDSLIKYTKERLQSVGNLPKILVIGALGRCGTGAVDFALKAGIPEANIIRWDMAETKKGGPFKEITEDADIFVNCIYLSSEIPPFITSELIDAPSRKLSVVVDVSCDTSNPHNPIPIYDQNSTFEEPTLSVASSNPNPLDVVAIDHLPTLLPREASDSFCEALLPSLLELKEGISNARVWRDAEKLYREKLSLV